MPGPMSKPVDQKKLAGTYDVSKEKNRAKPLPVKSVPVPPADPELYSPDQYHLYCELKEAVDALGVFCASDLIAFRQMVYMVTLLERTKESPAAFGNLITKAMAAMGRFGLTPYDRARWIPAASEEKQEDGLSEFAPKKPRLVKEGA